MFVFGASSGMPIALKYLDDMRVVVGRVVIVDQPPVPKEAFCQVNKILEAMKSGRHRRKIFALDAFVEFTNSDALGQLAAKDCAWTAIGPAGLFKNFWL